jgi:hypothetical protein
MSTRSDTSIQHLEAKLGHCPLPFDDPCVPKVIHENSITYSDKITLTAMKRATDFAMFFTSLAHVRGLGGSQKSLGGI